MSSVGRDTPGTSSSAVRRNCVASFKTAGETPPDKRTFKSSPGGPARLLLNNQILQPRRLRRPFTPPLNNLLRRKVALFGILELNINGTDFIAARQTQRLIKGQPLSPVQGIRNPSFPPCRPPPTEPPPTVAYTPQPSPSASPKQTRPAPASAEIRPRKNRYLTTPPINKETEKMRTTKAVAIVIQR